MLTQNTKDNHRIKFELVIEQINITCSDSWNINEHDDIISIHLLFYGSPGKVEIRTEGITKVKRTSVTQLDFILTWKHPPLLQFTANLSKRKGQIFYDKEKRPPELLLMRQSDGDNLNRLGSVKLLQLHELANSKCTGQLYEKTDKLSVNLKNNHKLLSCELLIKYRIPDTDPSVIIEPDGASSYSAAITPSVSTETINSEAPSTRSLKKPISKYLEQPCLIGRDANIYTTEWVKMHLIFLIFGTIPDFNRHLKILIQMLREDKRIGGYVEAVHICQGTLQADDVMWPYLPDNDPSNETFHNLFSITKPYSEHPKIFVVNKSLMEYYEVKDYQIERYIEDKNVIELYNLWNGTKLSSNCPRSSSMNESFSSPTGNLASNHRSPQKSNSCGVLPGVAHTRSSSYDSTHFSSTRSSIKNQVKVTDSKEYKDLEKELLLIKNDLVKTTADLQVTKAEKLDQQGTIAELNQKITKVEEMSALTMEMLQECQKENIFLRHQVILRGMMGFRSGPFNLFKQRWFQLEREGPREISPVITIYHNHDKLSAITLSEVMDFSPIGDNKFKISTDFADYVLSASSEGEMLKWLSGIQTLKSTFDKPIIQDSNTASSTVNS